MRQAFNIHTHSTWCDGQEKPRRMAEAALALGFTDLGFSSHSPAPFDASCPGIGDEAAYIAEIHKLKREYSGRLNVLCGVEMDYLAPVENSGRYDYIIGSVHYVRVGANMHTVDGGPEGIAATLRECFGGDALALARAYFGTAVDGARLYRPDVVAHFDLLTKYNAGNRLFNEEDAAYRSMATAALDEVLNTLKDSGGLLEVNTGAMARGLRKNPYPDTYLLRHAAQRRARVIIGSDCHHSRYLDFGFEYSQELLRQTGFSFITAVENGKFTEIKL